MDIIGDSAAVDLGQGLVEKTDLEQFINSASTRLDFYGLEEIGGDDPQAPLRS